MMGAATLQLRSCLALVSIAHRVVAQQQCSCDLTIQAVGDSITSESLWRQLLVQQYPGITMVFTGRDSNDCHSSIRTYIVFAYKEETTRLQYIRPRFISFLVSC